MQHLRKTDPEIAYMIEREEKRQQEGMELIASENYVSRAVLEAIAADMEKTRASTSDKSEASILDQCLRNVREARIDLDDRDRCLGDRRLEPNGSIVPHDPAAAGERELDAALSMNLIYNVFPERGA